MEFNGKDFSEKIVGNVSKVIIGKESVIKLLLTALIAGGHVLLEDVPGTGKTKLAKAFAKSIHSEFSRIQFTPDLLPGDITGLNIYDMQKNEFVLKKGPVFTNILLADEINRATPRTQAGLLECMEERQVTIDGVSMKLDDPFLVIATQNPIENAGTFPLPEAQMDRFIMQLSMGIPDREEELAIINRYFSEEPLDTLNPVLQKSEIPKAREEASKVFMHDSIKEYLVDLVRETRSAHGVLNGVSPRGTLAMVRCTKAYAYLNGRTFCIPDDVKAVAVPVLSHRILTGTYGNNTVRDNEKIIRTIVNQTPVPTEEFAV